MVSRAWKVWIARLLILTQCWSVLPAAAQQAALTRATNAPTGSQPLIDRAANGVPLVLLAPPSARGVSHNIYEQFNVGREGLILNNSPTRVQTQLGGWINGNLQYGKTAARLIVNEVNSTQTSALKGMMEVGGQAADVVVANPNGISCDGCGFLNTSGRATLTTGQPQFGPGGGLSGFDVRQGVINIGAAGLNAANLDQLDLIARGLVFDGEVYARRLNLLTGANQVLYGDLATVSQPGSGAAPSFAIDVARLGGMYTNQIYLVANELGLGVNSQGRIAVLDGALDLSVQGDLTLKDSYAKQGIKLAADKVALTGQTLAEQDIVVGTLGGIVNSATMQAGGHLLLDAPTLTNTGSMTQLATDQPLALDIPSSIVNSGTIYSPSDLRLSAPSISGSGGQLLAAGALLLTAGGINVDGQQLVANQDVTILAGSGGLRHVAGSADAGGKLTLSAAASDVAIAGSKLAASGKLTVNGERIVADDAHLAATGDLAVTSAASFSGQRAQLATGGNLHLSADTVDLGAATVSALGQLDITGAKSLAAAGASLAAQGDVSLSASQIAASAATLSSGARLKLAGSDIDLTQAKLSGVSGLAIAASSLNLDQAQALSGADLLLNAATLQGRKAVLAASHDVIIAAQGGLDLGGATVESQNAVNLKGEGISTAAASIAAPRVSVDAGSAPLDNRAGAILASASGDALSISATGVANGQGKLASNGALRLDLRGGALTNDGGTIAAPHATLLNLSHLSNRQGKLYADDDLVLSGFALDNNAGMIDTAGKLTLQGAGVDNSAGILYAKGAIGIDTGSASLQNPGGIIDSDGAGIRINAASVDNSAGGGKPGIIVAAGDVTLKISGALQNPGGRIAAGGALTLDSASLASDGGSLQSVAGLKLTTGDLSLDKGELLSLGDVSVKAGEVNAREGAINAGGALNLKGTNLLANGAQVGSGGATLLQFTGKITLDGGSVDSQGALTTSSASVSARQTQVRTNADLSVNAQDAELADARFAAAGNVQLRFGQLQAAGASVAAGGNLDLVADAVHGGLYSAIKDASVTTAQATDVSGGGLLAGGNASVRANGIVTDGAVVSGANVTLDAGSGGLSNVGGEIVAAGAAGGDGSGATLSITAHGIDNRRGSIASNDRASIDAQGQLVDNSGGLLQARSSLELDVGQIVNRGGSLASPGAIAIRSQGFDNAGGSVQSGGNISIDTQGQDLDNSAGLILAEGNAQLNGGRLLNAGGTIQANGSVNVAADSIDNRAGSMIAGRDLTVAASGAVASAQGKLISGGTLNLSGLNISADGAQISSRQDVNIQAVQDLALGSASITTGGALSLSGVGISADRAQLTSQQDTRIQAAQNLALGHASITAGGDVAINAGGAIAASGLTIAGKSNVALAAAAALDVSGGIIAAAGKASLSGTRVDNSGGVIDADGAVHLTASQGDINNAGGRITSRSALTLDMAAALNNASGTIESAAALAIDATELNNRDGRIYVQGPLAIRSGALDNTRGALAAALGDLDIDTGGKDYSGASGGLFAKGDLSLKSAAVDVGGGVLQAGGSLKLQATQLSGAASSMLAAKGDMRLDAGSGSIDLSDSNLQSAGALTLNGGQTRLDRAAVASGKGINLATAGLAMGQSRFDAAGAISMTTSGEIRGAGSQLYADGRIGVQASAFTGGIVSAGRDVAIATAGLTDVTGGALLAGEGMGVSVHAQGIRVDGATVSGDTVLLDAGSALLSARGGKIFATSAGDDALRLASVGLDNSDGQIATNGTARIDTGGGDLNDNHGSIGAARGLNIAAGAVDNRGGMISSEGGVTLSTTALDNSGGTVQSGQRLSLTTPGHDLANQGGTLLGMTGVDIAAGALDNSGGSVLAGGALTLNANGRVVNDQGQMISDAALTLNAASASNAGGLISSGLGLQFASAGAVDNSQGRMLSGAEFNLVAQGLANNAGQVASRGALELQLANFALSNRGGDIRSSEAGVTIVSGGVDSSRTDQAASIIAATTLSLASGGDVDNRGSDISAGTGLTLNASGRLVNSGASLIAGGDASVGAAEVDNSGGAIGAAGKLIISASSGAMDNSAASIAAGQDLSLDSQGLRNGAGSIAAAGNLAIDAGAGALDNQAGKIIAQGAASLRASGVDNREAQIAANGDVAIAAGSGALDTRAGEIRSAQGGLTLSAASIDSSAIGRVGALLSAAGNIALTSAGDWVNNGSRLTAGGKLVVQADGRLANAAGLIAAGGDASLSGRGLDNSGGTIRGEGALSIAAGSGAVSNAGGLISSAARLALSGGGTDNSDGQMLAAAAAEIRTAGFNNLRGVVAANDDVLLHAGSGTVDNRGGTLRSARGSLALNSGDLVNGASNGVMGLIAAAQDITVSASGAIDNRNNEIAAGRDLSLSAAGLVHNEQGRLVAARNLSLSGLGLENDGGVTGATGSVSLVAGASGMSNRLGQIVAQQDLDIRSSGDLANDQGAVVSGRNLTLASSALDNAAGQISAANSANLTATSLLNSAGASIVAGQDLSIDAGSLLDNGGGTLAANGDMALKAATVRISGSELTPGGRLSVQGATIDAAGSRIEAGTSVNLDAGSGSLNASASNIKAGQDIRLSAGAIGLNSSTVAANGDISVSGRSIDASSASITTPGNLSLTGDQSLLYSNAALAAGGDLALLSAGHAEHGNAQSLAGRDLSLASNDAFDFNEPGLSLRFGRDLSLRAEGISTQGYTLSANNLTLDAGSGQLNNRGGKLQAVDGMRLSGAGIDNRGGTIAANGAASLDTNAGRFDNSDGGLAYSSQASLSIAANSIDNRTGEIDAHDSISLSGGSLDNSGTSKIIAGNGLSVTLSADLNNSSGQLVSNAGPVRISAQGVNNSGGSIAGASDLALDAGAGTLDNSGGNIISQGTATVRAGSILNASSLIQAKQALDIAASGLLDNRGGALMSNLGDVTLGAAHLENSAHGAISSAAALTINTGQFDNAQGLLVANGQLTVNASGAIDNSSNGNIISNSGGVSLRGLTLDNRTGTVSAGQALQVGLTGALDNRGGNLIAGPDASVSAQGIDNSNGGVIAAQGSMSIDSGSGALNNSGGIIQSDTGSIKARSASLENRAGKLIAAKGALAVNTGALDNTLDGLIQAKQQVTIDTNLQSLNNAGGVISGLDSVVIKSGALNNDGGVIESGGGGISIDTHGNSLSNRNSGSQKGIVSDGNISIKSGFFDQSKDQSGGYTGASGNLNIEASEIDNTSGTLLAIGSVVITASDKLTNRGGNISAGTDMHITTPWLENSGGTVFAAGNMTLNIDRINNSNTKTADYTQGLLAGGDMSIDAQAIDNTNGAIVGAGDVNLKISDMLYNDGGEIGGRSITLDAPHFQNNSGRVDAQASLTARTPDYSSANGVLASNGSLAIALSGDYTNTSTLAANGDLSISTEGDYTNLGIVSSLQTLSFDVHDLTNGDASHTTAQLLGNALDLKASGTLTNSGLIDASGGTAHIAIAQLDNAGRIYGNAIDIQAQTLNNRTTAVIASRDELNIRGIAGADSSLNNDPAAQLLSIGDMTLTGNLVNNGGTVDASGNLSISGSVRNTNTGLQMGLKTSTEALNLTYYQNGNQGNNDFTKYRSDEVGWILGSGDFIVSPSTCYPFATFGSSPMSLEAPASNLDGYFVPAQLYSDNDPIWALFDVTPPAPPPSPPPGYGGCVEFTNDYTQRIYGEPCGAYWQAYDDYQVTRAAKSDEINAAIITFDVDLQSRAFSSWYQYNATGQTVTETQVLASAPGQILAGGNMQIGGSVTNEDSSIIAGRDLSAGEVNNQASPGTKQVTTDGQLFFSYREWHGGFHQNYSRTTVRLPDYHDGPVISSFDLPTLQYKGHANVDPQTAVNPTQPEGGNNAVVPVSHAILPGTRGDSQANTNTTAPKDKDLVDPTNSSNGQLHSGTVSGSGTSGTVNGVNVSHDDVTTAGVQVSGGGATANVTPGSVDKGKPDGGAIKASGIGSPTDGGNVNTTSTNGASVSGTHTNGVASDSASSANTSGPVLNDALPGSVIAAATRAEQQEAIAAVHTKFVDLVTTSPLTVIRGQPRAGTVQLTGANVAAPAKVSGPAGPNLAGPNYITLTSSAPVQAPGSLLFRINRAPGASYLVETDPAFTNERTWLGSSYFLQQLNLDPDRLGKRYGDGFAEQREIDDQIMALTGRRYLSGYAATEAEFQALMDAGVAYAKQYQLAPGVALTAEQMASLTTDIVWLQTENVTLPDGSVTQVIVPQVFLRRPKDGDLRPTGSLIAAFDINLRGSNDAVSNSGTIMAYGDPGQGSGTLTINAQEVTNSGTLAGHAITVASAGDIKNLGGAILGITGVDTSTIALTAGRDITLVTTTQTGVSANGSRTSVDRLATVAGGTVGLTAGRDIQLTGAKITASQDATLSAGRDLTASSIALDYSFHDGMAGGSRVSESGTTQALASVSAGRDLKIGAIGELNLKGTNLAAGNDLALTAADIAIASAKNLAAFDNTGVERKATVRNAASNETLAGGILSAGNNLTIEAINSLPATGSGNISLSGVSLTAGTDVAKLAANPLIGGMLSLKAANDISLVNLTTEHSELHEASRSSSGLFSRSSSQLKDASQLTLVEASTLSGERINAQAGTDIAVTGSAIAGTQDVTLAAAGKVDILAATGSMSQSHYYTSSESGLMSSGGFGITLGSRSQTDQLDASATGQSQARSLVGSSAGNLAISAGGGAKISGSDLVAGRDLTIVAKSVTLDPGIDQSQSVEHHESSQSGLTLGVSGGIIDLAQNIGTQVQGMESAGGDKRIIALRGITAAVKAGELVKRLDIAGQDLSSGDLKGADAASGAGISLSIGSSQSKSENTSTALTHSGATALAGGKLAIQATEGDIDATGSTLAGQNVALAAAKDIKLLAATDSTSERSSNSASSSSVGVTYSMGGTANGFSLQIAASQAKGNANGDSATQQNTVVAATDTLSMKSGADTTLAGAQASANKITAEVGGNLNIASTQDTATYKATQSSSGVSLSICVPPFCYGTSSASVSASQAKTDSNYASVTQQSGLFAGDGGFDVKVKANTDLKGGVIASTASPDKNSLTTGTLTMSDIQNKTDTTSSSSGVRLGTSMLSSAYDATKGVAGNLMNNGKATAHDVSTTTSAIAAGTLTITDSAAQTALTGKSAADTVATTNRDTTDANRALAKPDVTAVQKAAKDQQAAKMVTFETLTTLTDKTYEAKVLLGDKTYRVVCREEPCTWDPALGIDPNRKDKDGNPNIVLIEMTPAQVAALSNEEKAKIVVAGNGILNNLSDAARLALQNATAETNVQKREDSGNTKPDIILAYRPTAGNILSDHLGGAYEKFLSTTLGPSTPDKTLTATVQEVGTARDAQGNAIGTNPVTVLLHSEATTAWPVVTKSLAADGNRNDALTVQAKGSAESKQTLIAATAQVNPKVSLEPETFVKFSANPNDPVPTLTLSNPQGNLWGSLLQLPATWATNTSAHSCYGTGGMGCNPAHIIDQQYSYGDTKVKDLNATRAAHVADLLRSGPVVSSAPLAPINRPQEQFNQLTQLVGTAALPPPVPVFWLTVPPAAASADPRVNAVSQLLQQLKPGGQ